MPVKYTIDILTALKAAGYSTHKLRKEKILAEATIQKIRKGQIVSWAQIERLCALLNCKVGDLVYYEKDSPARDGEELNSCENCK